ncbi:MAG: PadR family transcriptional regulator [Planctomycetota bacterium]
MSVRHSLLALLAEQPAHGYGLKSEFEANTGGTWPLNVGQVYTTLRRLERDGLVEPVGAEAHDGRQTWRITRAGRQELTSWFATPIASEPPSRDELAIKVLLAVSTDQKDVSGLLQAQRVATMERLQSYTRHKRHADPTRELPWLLLLDALIVQAEAEIKWLDLCEARLRQREERA